MEALALPPGEVHLWSTRPDDPRQVAAEPAQQAVLCDDEQARQRRFLHDRHRRLFRVSHALLRDALSRYAPWVEPRAWRFAANEHGRPHVAFPAQQQWIRFSLSHTDGRAVVALARGVEVGVDVEAIVDSHSPGGRAGDLEMARENFHASEVAQLERRPALFLDLWTLKEAFLKARGVGLGTVPLDSFAFDLADAAHPRIAFADRCLPEREAEAWWFALHRAPDLRLALAARTGGLPLQVVAREIVPFGPDEAVGGSRPIDCIAAGGTD